MRACVLCGYECVFPLSLWGFCAFENFTALKKKYKNENALSVHTYEKTVKTKKKKKKNGDKK